MGPQDANTGEIASVAGVRSTRGSWVAVRSPCTLLLVARDDVALAVAEAEWRLGGATAFRAGGVLGGGGFTSLRLASVEDGAGLMVALDELSAPGIERPHLHVLAVTDTKRLRFVVRGVRFDGARGGVTELSLLLVPDRRHRADP